MFDLAAHTRSLIEERRTEVVVIGRDRAEPRNARYFEDFAAGDLYEHPAGRTVRAADNWQFNRLTRSPALVDFAGGVTAKPLVHPTLTLAIVTGQSAMSMHLLANLAWERVDVAHPVCEGDTIYSRSTVLGRRPSMSRPEAGIVRLRTEGYNQHGVVVVRLECSAMVCWRGTRPDRAHSAVAEPA